MRIVFIISVLILLLGQSNLYAEIKIPRSPFEKNKIQINETKKINSETKLIAMINMDCVKEKGLNSLTAFQDEIVLIDETPKLFSHLKVFQLQLKKAMSAGHLKKIADSSKCIIGVSNDGVYQATFTDPLFSQQTQHPFLHTEEFYTKAQWLPVAESARAVVAVIDTGVDYNHSDLTNMMFRQNGAIVGASFVTGTSDFLDDHGHGTHVSGLAAAEINNGIGGIGVCGMSCFIMPVKVLNAQGSGSVMSVTNGVLWAVDHGANVLNLSLGRTINFLGQAPLELEAFRYAMMRNVVIAIAAGNEGAVLSKTGAQSWPAMFAEEPGLITVASVDANSGALSTFSNRGPRYVEIAAPGSTSSINGVYVGLLSTALGGGYTTLSGTSMATPIVAGALGLTISYYKKFNLPYNVWDIEMFLKSATVVNPNLVNFVEAGHVLNLSVLADKLQAARDNPYHLDIHDVYQSFVVDLYYIILRRNYDVGGAQFTLSLMLNNRLYLETMIWNFFSSPEFRSNFGDLTDRQNTSYFPLISDQFIPDAYLMILGHLPSKADADYWTNYLTVYKNKHRLLLRTLLQSSEFNARVAGTKLATYPRMEALPSDAHERCNAKNFTGDFSIEKQVDFGYCTALERTPDAGGRAFYINLLKNGVRLEDIYLGMFRSPEFRDLNQIDQTTDRDYVNILYYSILERFPADFESFYWIDVLKTHARDEVLNAFIVSAEFNQLLKTKKIRN